MLHKLFNFRDQIIFVTGSSGQMGTAISKLFLNLGAKVYGLDVKRKKIKHRNFKFIKIDITNELQTNIEIKKIFKKEKKIDIIINNAGISIYSRIEKRSSIELQTVFDLNLKSIINIIKYYLKNYKKYKLKNGRIINIGSIYGFLSPDFKIYSKGKEPIAEIYGATKASVIQITKYFAVLLANYGIRVNCISPGGVLNKKTQTNKFIKKYSNRVPLKRMAKVEDILTSILYLASKESKYVTGQNIIVDGGLSLK